MNIGLEMYKHYGKNEWLCLILPSLGIGYCDKLLSITLYLFVWEFSIIFDWEE